MADQCQNKETNKKSKLDDIVEATQFLRQGYARIAKARELLKEIPENLYHKEILGKAHWDINKNVEKLTQMAVLIDEHNKLKIPCNGEKGE